MVVLVIDLLSKSSEDNIFIEIIYNTKNVFLLYYNTNLLLLSVIIFNDELCFSTLKHFDFLFKGKELTKSFFFVLYVVKKREVQLFNVVLSRKKNE